MISCNPFNEQPIPLTFMESLLLKRIREFSDPERMKIFDLLHRFSMARLYTGEIKFDFHWLLAVEKDYEPLVHPEQDVLGHFQNVLVSQTER